MGKRRRHLMRALNLRKLANESRADFEARTARRDKSGRRKAS